LRALRWHRVRRRVLPWRAQLPMPGLCCRETGDEMSTGGQALPERARVILRGVVGSTIHGVSVGGQDDRDEMGICIEPPDYVIGLRHFETHVWRTQPEGVKSGPGDLDLTIHSLRKFMRLAAKGNPTIITLLYLPDE